LTDADAELLYAAILESLSHLQPWLPGFNEEQSIDDTRVFIRRSQAQWLLGEAFRMAIVARTLPAAPSQTAERAEGDGLLLGGIVLHPRDWKVPSFEISYWLRRSAEGQGYMSEATRLLTSFAFEGLGAQRLMISCDARNVRSKAVPERLGYV